MTSLGALVLTVRQKFEHGPYVAWNRDVVRHRILSTPPVEGTSDPKCEIHALTSGSDWLNLIWALKSFYRVTPDRYALCIHEDGSLSIAELEQLRHHFPAARIIRRDAADRRMSAALQRLPRSAAFRQGNTLSLKIFDFLEYLEADRLVLFDSDLLFFTTPTAFVEKVNDRAYKKNIFNEDVADAYTLEPRQAKLLGYELSPRINSGFALVRPESILRDLVEEFLCLPGILDGHPWRIEQTLFALCSSRYGVELLPSEYSVRLDRGIRSRPMRHYVGAIRHLMYREGMPKLIKLGILDRNVA